MLKSSIIVSIISLIISVISFANQIVIAKIFGANKQMDFYLLASSIPTMFGGIIAAALSYSLTPHFIKNQSILGDSFSFYFGLFLKKSTFILILFSTISCSVYSYFIPVIYPKLNAPEIFQIRIIAIISWIGFNISVLVSLLTSYYNSKKYFILPLALNFSPFLISIISTLLLNKYMGVSAVVLGTVVGTTISFLILIGKIKNEFILLKDYDKYFSEIYNKYIKYLWYAIIAMLCFTIYQSIDSFWAPRLGTSNLSYLGYCQRIIVAFGTLIVIGPSTVIIPRLTKAVLEKREIDFLNDTAAITKLVIALSSVVAVIVSILSKQVIRIMFQRGAFKAGDTNAIAGLLPYMVNGMVFMLCVVILFRVLFIKEKGGGAAFIGAICAVLYFSLSGVLSNSFSVKGIAYSYSITWIIIFIITINFVFNKNKKILYSKANATFLAKQVIHLILVYFLVLYLSRLFTLDGGETSLTKVFIFTSLTGVVSFIFYIVCSLFVLKISDVRALVFGVLSLVTKSKRLKENYV